MTPLGTCDVGMVHRPSVDIEKLVEVLGEPHQVGPLAVEEREATDSEARPAVIPGERLRWNCGCDAQPEFGGSYSWYVCAAHEEVHY